MQYRECLHEVNGGDENRVHLPNIELSYIRQLQHDNSELRSLLEEHQAALEIIMGKYRQQVCRSCFPAGLLVSLSYACKHLFQGQNPHLIRTIILWHVCISLFFR